MLPLLFIPTQIILSELDNRILGGFINKFLGKYVSKGSGLGVYSWAFILTTFFVDDFGTSMGLQAKEWTIQKNIDELKVHHEGNPHMSLLCEKMRKTFGLTESLTFRIMFLYHMATMYVANYFGLVGPYLRIMFNWTGFLKFLAGYRWWLVKPNDFSFWENLFFEPGEYTPYRLSHELMNLKISELNLPRRRRLKETTNLEFLKTIRNILFPVV